MRELDDLEKKLIDRAADAASVQEISDVAAALKTVADARSAATPAIVAARRAYTLELIKALSALFVPIVSLLALAGTILVQTQQIAASRQQTENSEWRELLTSIKGEPGSFTVSDVTVAPRLMSFASSPMYGRQAKAIAIRIMGRLRNIEGFQDLLSYVFAEVTAENFADVISVSRALVSTRRHLDEQCDFIVKDYQENDPNRVLRTCTFSLTDKQFADLNILNKPVRDEIAKIRPIHVSLLWESFYLTQKVIPYLRSVYGKSSSLTPKPPLDLSNVWFQNGDFSRMDLSQWDITGSFFTSPNFEGTNLNFQTFPKYTTFDKANWWDAEIINPDLLKWFITNDYPLDTDQSVKARSLCARADLTCP